MEFNIEDLSREVTQHLKGQVDQVSDDFNAHRAMVANKLHDGQQTNQTCLQLQNETVGMRVEQNTKITEVMNESSAQLFEFHEQNAKKDAQRAKLADALKTQRENEIALNKD